jgi:hypothetical protein
MTAKSSISSHVEQDVRLIDFSVCRMRIVSRMCEMSSLFLPIKAGENCRLSVGTGDATRHSTGFKSRPGIMSETFFNFLVNSSCSSWQGCLGPGLGLNFL